MKYDTKYLIWVAGIIFVAGVLGGACTVQLQLSAIEQSMSQLNNAGCSSCCNKGA